MRSTTRRRKGLLPAALACLTALSLSAAVLLAEVSPASSATATCVISPGLTSAYSVKVCLTSPAPGATLTGEAAVTATVTITGTSPGLAKTEFTLNGSYLLTDFQSPYTFSLRSADFADGVYTLEVGAILRDGYTPPPTPLSLTFSNGMSGPRVNDRTWAQPTATPRSWQAPTILAATGDGAGGESNAASVVSLMAGWNPDLVAYTGDVYEKGTLTEFRNWYGSNGSLWSQFRDRTLPVVGNHEYENNQAPGYFDYWDNIPHYYSTDINGWHIIGLDTTSQYNQATPGTAQYEWLAQDLADNTSPCTIVTGHHPLYNIGKELPALRLQALWQLMAARGVTMFLVGHDHTYQRWTPLDGSGNPAATGVTELVIGTGGHSSQSAATSDFRVLSYAKAYGAARLALYGDHLSGQYFTTAGSVTDTFTLPCRGADGIDPDPLTGLTAQSVTAGDGTEAVDLNWNPATDNVGVTGYRISRDGTVLAETSATSYLDAEVLGATDYSYSVQALDAAGNTSGAVVDLRTAGADTTPPSTPVGLRFTTASPISIELSWEESTDNTAVAAYEVRRDDLVVATVGGTDYADAVDGPVDHVYTVVALDAAGNRSDPSAPVTARSQDLAPPGAPTGLAASVSGGQVVLAWLAPGSGTPVVSYDILRDGAVIGESTATTFTDQLPISQTTHTYTVAAVSEAGVRSEPSPAVDVTVGDTEEPSAPSDPAASASGPNSVTVTWTAAVDNVAVTEYRISRGGVQVAVTDGATQAWTDTGLLSQTSYSYTVRAVDAAGNVSAASVAASVTTPGPTPQVAIADSYANASSPTTTYATTTALRLDGDPQRRPYIMLPVSAGTGSVVRARLRVYLQSKLTTGFTVSAVAPTWTEKSLTWNSAPQPTGNPVPSGAVPAAGWVEIDVTSLIQPGSPTLSVALLSSSGTSVSVSSRESANRPALLVDWSG